MKLGLPKDVNNIGQGALEKTGEGAICAKRGRTTRGIEKVA